ncbi:MAG: SDR family oxidoreductase [Rhodospirillales bacterium]|nr:MAG: SDR family oxidoreductase [Rhodospirillales bacterium]
MTGKVVVITGGTAGIGRVTARELARRGAAVVVVGRDRDRGGQTVAELNALGGTGCGAFVQADLSVMAEVRRVAETVTGAWPVVDVLINNAGGMFGRRILTPEGIEATFALNHLSYFLLTDRLLPALRQAPAARIVNVASHAHFGVRLDFDDLQSARRFGGYRAYKRSKLCNLYFTYELARRLEGRGITVNALHPGFVATDIGLRNRWVPRSLWRLFTLFAIDVDKGAETPIHLACSPEVVSVSGRYFFEKRPVRSSAVSYDQAAAQRLWEISADLTEIEA